MLKTKLRAWDGDRLCNTGAIVVCHVDDRRAGGGPAINHRFRRFIVDSFPGGELGHCANVRALDNREQFTVAAGWLEIVG